MSDTALKYDLPKGGQNPFDIHAKGNYFVYANAYSNLSPDLSAFSLEELDKHIPMGYKTIVICHRVSLIGKGTELASWPFNEAQRLKTDAYSGKYFLTAEKPYNWFVPDWERSIETAVIYRPETKDAALISGIWDDIEICRNFALKHSLENNSSCLISVVIDAISWH